MLDNVLAVIGPPGTGKTTLTTLLGAEPARSVFRLRDHVPPAILAATATSPGQPVRIHDVTVARAHAGESRVRDSRARSVTRSPA